MQITENTQGWVAVYRDGEGPNRPVVVWKLDDDGDVLGLVADAKPGLHGYLASALHFAGFLGYERIAP